MVEHSSFVSSSLSSLSDNQTWITTTTSPQTFDFIDTSDPKCNTKYALSSIRITAHDTNDVAVKYNNDNSIDYISSGETIETEDFIIRRITIVSPVGTKFKFKGLSFEVYTVNK